MTDSPGLGSQNIQADYLWSVAAKKVSYMIVKGVVALAGSSLATQIGTKYGIALNPTVLQSSVAIGTLGVVEWIHDYLKVKTGKNWL